MKKTRINLKKSPIPMKVAASKALKELGFTYEMIAKITGLGKRSVERYVAQGNEEAWREFGEAIKKIYLQQDFELTQLAVKHIKEKIPRARFYELVGLLKVVRDLQKDQNAPQVAIQINTKLEEKKKNYSLE